MSDEEPQQRILGWRQLHLLSSSSNDARGEIHLHVATAEYGIGTLRLAVSQRSAQPCQQLAGAERLGYVIIRPGVQSSYLICLAVANRQNKDRQSSPLPQTLEHLKAFHVREAEVQQDDVRPTLRCLEHSVLPGGRVSDTIAVSFQRDTKQTANLRLVIDHERIYPRCFLFGAHEISCTGGATSDCGSRNENNAPPPGRFSTAIVPPCASMKPFAMVSPNPLPPVGASGAR